MSRSHAQISGTSSSILSMTESEYMAHSPRLLTFCELTNTKRDSQFDALARSTPDAFSKHSPARIPEDLETRGQAPARREPLGSTCASTLRLPVRDWLSRLRAGSRRPSLSAAHCGRAARRRCTGLRYSSSHVEHDLRVTRNEATDVGLQRIRSVVDTVAGPQYFEKRSSTAARNRTNAAPASFRSAMRVPGVVLFAEERDAVP